jgi:hypothetical protein
MNPRTGACPVTRRSTSAREHAIDTPLHTLLLPLLPLSKSQPMTNIVCYVECIVLTRANRRQVHTNLKQLPIARRRCADAIVALVHLHAALASPTAPQHWQHNTCHTPNHLTHKTYNNGLTMRQNRASLRRSRATRKRA